MQLLDVLPEVRLLQQLPNRLPARASIGRLEGLAAGHRRSMDANWDYSGFLGIPKDC